MKYAALLVVLLLTFSGQKSLAEVVTTQLGKLTLNARLEAAEGWPGGTTILITHGTASHNGSELIQGLQSLFAEYDVSSLAINLSLGIDNRQGPVDCQAIQHHKHEDAPVEIASWVAWLKTQGAKQLVVMGHSRGGNQTAMYLAANADPAVMRMILLAPALMESKDPAPGYQKYFGKTLAPLLVQAHSAMSHNKPHEQLNHVGFLYCRDACVDAASFLSYYEVKPQWRTSDLLDQIEVPVLVISGSEDTTVPGIAKALSSLTSSHLLTVVNIDGADHFFRDLYADELVELAVDWLNSSP